MAERRMRCAAERTRIAGMVGSLLLVWLVTACGKTSTPTAGAAPFADECVLAATPQSTADTVSIALNHDVDLARAPNPHSSSDRLIYRQLYQTLVRVDCNGSVRPDLAHSWSRKDGGRRWSFSLRPTAQFWDGTPVTATLVVDSWLATGAATRHGLAADSLSVTGARELEVVLRQPRRSVPTLLAAPDMAVVKWSPGVAWPLGTGQYRVAEHDSRRTVAVTAFDGSDGARPVIEFRTVSGRDLRDVIDGRYDLLLTSDTRALDYAAAQPDRDIVALPWETSYVFAAATSIGDPLDSGDHSDIGLSQETREALARDAVSAEARASIAPEWWQEIGQCSTASDRIGRPVSRERPGSRFSRIAFESSDSVARGLAERIVALGGGRSGEELLLRLGVSPLLVGSISTGAMSLQAVAVDTEPFRRAVLAGLDLAYVLALPRLTYDPCRTAADLSARAPWVFRQDLSFDEPSYSTLHGTLAPLVDTRKQAILNRGRIGLVLDWDGSIALILP